VEVLNMRYDGFTEKDKILAERLAERLAEKYREKYRAYLTPELLAHFAEVDRAMTALNEAGASKDRQG
jgi:hypothetical protein